MVFPAVRWLFNFRRPGAGLQKFPCPTIVGATIDGYPDPWPELQNFLRCSFRPPGAEDARIFVARAGVSTLFGTLHAKMHWARTPFQQLFLAHVVPPLYSRRESSVTNGTIGIGTIQRRLARDDTHKSSSEHRSPPTLQTQVKGIKVNDVENQPCYRGWRFIFYRFLT